MNRVESITGVVLAGGQGRRLNHRDKGLIDFDGRPLIEHTLERLSPQVDEVLINANRNLEAYRGYGLSVFSDLLDGFQGPLAGIAAALHHVRTPWLQIVPADGPRLPQDLVHRLRSALANSEYRIALPFDGRRLQPLHMLMHRDLGESLNTYLSRGDRKVMLWIEQQSPVTVAFDVGRETFETVNTPQQHQRLQNVRAHG